MKRVFIFCFVLSVVVISAVVFINKNISAEENRSRAIAISAGFIDTALATENAMVYYWGNGINKKPVKMGFGDGVIIKDISVTGGHTLALSDSGQIYGWGMSYEGQLAKDNRYDKPQLIPMPEKNIKIISIKTTLATSFLLTDDGRVFSFGSNEDGALGVGSADKKSEKVAEVKFPTTSRIKAIYSGANHIFALTLGGKLYAWGDNANGQLGVGVNVKSSNTPIEVKIPKGVNIKLVFAGVLSGFIITENNKIFVWGYNNSGGLGVKLENSDINKYTEDKVCFTPKVATEFEKIKDIKTITAGFAHTLILTEDGTLYSLGGNSDSALGLGDKVLEADIVLTPTVVTFPKPDTKIKLITTGIAHNIAVATDGSIYTWGMNNEGQLGVGDKENRNSPTEINLSIK